MVLSIRGTFMVFRRALRSQKVDDSIGGVIRGHSVSLSDQRDSTQA